MVNLFYLDRYVTFVATFPHIHQHFACTPWLYGPFAEACLNTSVAAVTFSFILDHRQHRIHPVLQKGTVHEQQRHVEIGHSVHHAM